MRASMRYFLAPLMGLVTYMSLMGTEALASKQDFVRVENGRFKLGQEDFFFVGSNFYRLALSDRFSGKDYKSTDAYGRTTYPLVDDVFDGYVKSGVKVVRVWGFSCEGAKGHTSSPSIISPEGIASSPIRFQTEAIDKLDYVLAAASRTGVKVILPLVNFEHEYCGMEWWVENTLGGGSDKHLFYTNDKVWDRFTAYTRALLERKNPYTGREYRDEPSIMAIELANEPHTKDYYECTSRGYSESDCRDGKVKGAEPGTLVYEWLSKFSAFVKTVDSKHLLSHGEEGYLARPDGLESECREKHQWIHNGSKGTDYARNATIKDIDFLTTHVYPDNWNIAPSELPWVKKCIFEHRASIAKSVKKPIILEETGFNERPDNYGQKDYKLDRPYYLSRMFRMATEAGFAGTMVWQAVPLLRDEQPADDDDFTFPLAIKSSGNWERSPEGLAVEFQVSCMNEHVPYGRFDQCVSICPKNTSVDEKRYGSDPEGKRCYLPVPGVGELADPFPKCDNGSADSSAWGWTTNKDLCLAHPEAAKQYPTSGGCSCKA